MHAYQTNLLKGIPDEYNVATIDDIKDVVQVIHARN
jgi:hypothetical protein